MNESTGHGAENSSFPFGAFCLLRSPFSLPLPDVDMLPLKITVQPLYTRHQLFASQAMEHLANQIIGRSTSVHIQ